MVGNGRHLLPRQSVEPLGAGRQGDRAAQIGTAIYDPKAGQVTLTMKDGTSFAVRAGAGVEQWEPEDSTDHRR